MNRKLRWQTYAMSNGVACSLLAIALAPGQMKTGQIPFEIFVTDGTDLQARPGTLVWAAVNKAGVISTTVSVEGLPGAELAQSDLTKTLEVDASATTGTSVVTLKLTVTSSLTPTAMTVAFTNLNVDL